MDSFSSNYKFAKNAKILKILYAKYMMLEDIMNSLEIDNESEMFEKLHKIETMCVIPLVFDHKIANSHGSWPWLTDFITTPVSRKPIDNLSWKNLLDLVTQSS